MDIFETLQPAGSNGVMFGRTPEAPVPAMPAIDPERLNDYGYLPAAYHREMVPVVRTVFPLG